jgi:predicted ATPase
LRQLNFALAILDESCWETDYELVLALYNAAAEIEYTVGDFSQVESMTSEVLTHALSFNDKIQAYSTRLYMLGSTSRPSEAITLGWRILVNDFHQSQGLDMYCLH